MAPGTLLLKLGQDGVCIQGCRGVERRNRVGRRRTASSDSIADVDNILSREGRGKVEPWPVLKLHHNDAKRGNLVDVEGFAQPQNVLLNLFDVISSVRGRRDVDSSRFGLEVGLGLRRGGSKRLGRRLEQSGDLSISQELGDGMARQSVGRSIGQGRRDQLPGSVGGLATHLQQLHLWDRRKCFGKHTRGRRLHANNPPVAGSRRGRKEGPSPGCSASNRGEVAVASHQQKRSGEAVMELWRCWWTRFFGRGDVMRLKLPKQRLAPHRHCYLCLPRIPGLQPMRGRAAATTCSLAGLSSQWPAYCDSLAQGHSKRSAPTSSRSNIKAESLAWAALNAN